MKELFSAIGELFTREAIESMIEMFVGSFVLLAVIVTLFFAMGAN